MESVNVFSPAAYSGLLPEYAVLGGILAICLTIFLIPRLAAGVSVWISLLAICLAFFYAAADEKVLLPSGLQFSSSTGILKQYFCVSASVALFQWLEWRQERSVTFSPLFPCLLLTSILSLMILVQASELWLMILAAEGFSFSAYCLAAWNSDGADTGKSALRYFGVGALATGISIFGFTWITGFSDAVISGEGGFSDSLHFSRLRVPYFFWLSFFLNWAVFPFNPGFPGFSFPHPRQLRDFWLLLLKLRQAFYALILLMRSMSTSPFHLFSWPLQRLFWAIFRPSEAGI